MKHIILSMIIFLSLNSLALAVPVPPTQDDINNEVSALVDAQNQKKYDDAQKAVKDNQDESGQYSNCPNCPH